MFNDTELKYFTSTIDMWKIRYRLAEDICNTCIIDYGLVIKYIFNN